MMFNTLVQREARIAALSATKAKADLIHQTLAEAGEDAPKVALMLCGTLTLPADDRTTGIKETFLAKDLALETRALEDIIEAARERVRQTNDSPALDVAQAWALFQHYLDAPHSKTAVKSDFITKLFYHATDGDEISFLFRLLVGKMSNGVQETTIVNAISEGDAKRAYALNPDLWQWVRQWQDLGVTVTANVAPTLLQPITPQLCARVSKKDGLESVLDTYHPAGTMVQEKYDGLRVHVHRFGEVVYIFTRALKDITADYPEVAEAALSLRAEKFILDGELVAVAADGDILPFNQLQKRLGRKTRRSEVKVGVVTYDLLYAEESLVDAPYWARLADLLFIVPLDDPVFRVAKTTSATKDTGGDLRQMLLEAHENGREGLVCKDPNSISYPGFRGAGKERPWIKLKPAYMEESDFGDTVDLIVTGYEMGRGKRHGKVGALSLSARYMDEGSIGICKVGTGFTDEELDWWTEELVTKGVQGGHVVEIRADEVTLDKYGMVSLRFPRYIRRRDDKHERDATHFDELVEVIG